LGMLCFSKFLVTCLKQFLKISQFTDLAF
jgi:hypothetical protein